MSTPSNTDQTDGGAQQQWPALSIVVNVEEGSHFGQSLEVIGGPDPVDELGVATWSAVRNFGNESNYVRGGEGGLRVSNRWTNTSSSLHSQPLL